MGTQVQNSIEMLHPILIECAVRIQTEIIGKYNIPIKLFETGRSFERHQHLLSKGRTQNIISKHLYDLNNEEMPLYSEAVDFVFYDGRWSWNLRDSTTAAWYILFGNLVLDKCPEIKWSGNDRKSQNFTHFELRKDVVIENFGKYKCVLHS